MRLDYKQITPVMRFSGQVNSKANEDCTLFRCSVCKEMKPRESFFKNKSKSQGITAACKVCHLEQRKRYLKEGRMTWGKYGNKENKREWALIKTYGITNEDYDEMRVSQDHRCAICKTHETELKRVLNVDHCHKTGIIRGLLCIKCNHAIGLLKENIQSFNNAIEYLQRNK